MQATRPLAHFYSPGLAVRIMLTGQRNLRTAVESLRAQGVEVVSVDTDGIRPVQKTVFNTPLPIKPYPGRGY